MAINDAWGFEAEIITCNEDAEAAIRYGYGEDQGDPMVVNCEVAARWPSLTLEITELWSYEFRGSGLGHWGFESLDLNPQERALPLGYDGLEAWETWLAATDPEAAVRYFNWRGRQRVAVATSGKSGRRQGDSNRAGRLGSVRLSRTTGRSMVTTSRRTLSSHTTRHLPPRSRPPSRSISTARSATTWRRDHEHSQDARLIQIQLPESDLVDVD